MNNLNDWLDSREYFPSFMREDVKYKNKMLPCCVNDVCCLIFNK